MNRYIGTKVISAKPMNRGEYNEFRGWTIPADENPADEGYLVEYTDGYISWSPKDTFDDAYRPCDFMNFGLALEALKMGYKVARRGWNGRGMYLYITSGSKVKYEDLKAETRTALNWTYEEGMEVPINAHIDMKAADHSVVIGWLASQTDMLADDWEIVG